MGFVGFPSVGKVSLPNFVVNHIFITRRSMQSTLMSKLTGTHSEVSEIDFTTLTTVPGTLKVHGAPIQILDLREHMLIYFSFCLHPCLKLVSSKVPMMVEEGVDKVSLTKSPTPYFFTNNIQSSSHCRYGGLQHFTIEFNPAKHQTQLHEHVISSSLFLMSSNPWAIKE